MKDRRNFLKLANDSIWVTPILGSVCLPAHAMTSSSQTWSFFMTYNELCESCDSDNRRISPIDPPRLEEQDFIVTLSEIESGAFVKTVDFDGSGPVSDFSSYNFTIIQKNNSEFTGSVERRDADGPEFALRGNFEAAKI